MLRREEQSDIDRNAGEDCGLDGREPFRVPGNFDEEVGLAAYMALSLGKVRRVRHSGNGHWSAGSRIHGCQGRSAKQGSRGPLQLSGSEPRLGKRNRPDSEEG